MLCTLLKVLQGTISLKNIVCEYLFSSRNLVFCIDELVCLINILSEFWRSIYLGSHKP